ncbi:aspartic proteinase CDR1-like [Solanum dulcamara]|uniref:aspartic proteinase CDR1-like n=1 Tax=Solanum dulcamara TaxID=45834 RepID=UPI0024853DAB|nr:aspartic proteinase CDR1-like [Solanum dulcamara]
MNSKVIFLLSILAFLSFSQLALVSCRKAKTNHGLDGFTLDLIHRDSPLSPYYNPSITPSQRLRDACHRSFSRASFFTKVSIHPTTPFNHAIQSDIIPIPAEYLMKIAIGTPPRETFAIADTGSDLTWIQCKPCTHCFEQILPLFDPRKSSTYKIIGCHSNKCEAVGGTYCVRKNVCEYQMRYGDNSYSIGDVASETFTFASTTSKTKKIHNNISIPHVVFGCGHDNGGTFNNFTAGIVGLGGSKISFIKQLDKQIKGKFSYCLIPIDLSAPFSFPPNATGKINFGPKAVVSGPNVVTTPIIRKYPDTFYYLNLESVSVGEKKLKFKSSQFMSPSAADEDLGNIIIDSGTTLTFLPEEFYNKLESTLVEKIKGKRKKDPLDYFPLCYETKSVVDFPKIVFHFTDADVELVPMSTFAEVDKDLTCLTIVNGGDDGAVYGNLAQMNFLIGYDVVNHKLSFLPTDCTKH